MLNPSNENFRIEFAEADVSKATVRAFGPTGAEVKLGDITADDVVAVDSGGATGGKLAVLNTNVSVGTKVQLVVDGPGLSRVVIYDLKDSGDNSYSTRSLTVGLQLLEVADTNVADRTFEWGDSNQGDLTVRSWNEIQTTANVNTVDTSTASAAATVKWYDPRGVAVVPTIERFVGTDGILVTNDANDAALGGKIQFARPDLNLDQVDFTRWNWFSGNQQ